MTYPKKFFIDELQGNTLVLEQTHWFRLSKGNYLIRWSDGQGLVKFSVRRLPTQVEHDLPKMSLPMFLPTTQAFYRKPSSIKWDFTWKVAPRRINPLNFSLMSHVLWPTSLAKCLSDV